MAHRRMYGRGERRRENAAEAQASTGTGSHEEEERKVKQHNLSRVFKPGRLSGPHAHRRRVGQGV